MKRNIKACALVVFLWLLNGTCPVWAQQDASNAGGFGGGYNNLRPQQKRLADDWFKRFSAVVQKPVEPAEGYENLPLSVKTTFNAVTHALLMTKLTDDSGKSLGESAIELIDKVDNVAGQVPGAGGDRQFRIYVQLKPGALEILQKSREFKRGPDNTVYHKGYPICFRSTGGTPSIQVSLTRDAARADVDVDYRSSKFPVFLVNGHLTASNSDVRAANNDSRHNGQWAGLQNWWRDLLGLSLVATPRPVDVSAEGAIPSDPKEKLDKPADAVFDFLSTWLVEQQPNQSIPYFAEQAYACIEVERGEKIDRGMAKYTMLRAMQALNEQVGKVSTLNEVSLGVRLSGERVKVIEQPHHAQFVLYDVREDLAEQFNCVNKVDTAQISPKAMNSKAFGKYVGAVFRLKAHDQTGETVATLWQKDHGYWKMISFDVEPELDKSRVPDVTAPVAATAPLSYVEADKDMISASGSFLDQWLVKKNLDKALDFISPQCFACVNLYRADDVPAPSTPEEARELLKKGMATTAAALGKVKSLNDAIIAPEPHHEDLKLVKHANAKAFVVVSIPEYMADAANCERRKPGVEPDFAPAPATGYGKYYATGFSFANTVENPAVLWIVWGKVSGSWKAVSYVLLTP